MSALLSARVLVDTVKLGLCYSIENEYMEDGAVISEGFLEMLQAVSHVNRLRLIECLSAGEMDVQSLQRKLSLGQSTVSQHLAILRNRKLVRERRAGRHVYYKLTLPSLTEWLFHGINITTALEREAVAREHAANSPIGEASVA
jgi:DNA-binding transcriptional ArsR family regulator